MPFLYIARVNREYLGCDTHFGDGLPQYMSCPFSSNLFVVKASVSGRLVVIRYVFDPALFDFGGWASV